jgi:hypothetical protein
MKVNGGQTVKAMHGNCKSAGASKGSAGFAEAICRSYLSIVFIDGNYRQNSSATPPFCFRLAGWTEGRGEAERNVANGVVTDTRQQ